MTTRSTQGGRPDPSWGAAAITGQAHGLGRSGRPVGRITERVVYRAVVLVRVIRASAGRGPDEWPVRAAWPGGG